MLGSARSTRGRLGLVLLAAIVVSRCSNAAVSKAVGTAGDTAAPILIEASSTTITVANHAGRPLLDVRISLETAESQQPFLGVIPTIDTGATGSLALGTELDAIPLRLHAGGFVLEEYAPETTAADVARATGAPLDISHARPMDV